MRGSIPSMPHVLQVGRPYNPKVRRWPEANQYNYRGGEHELAMFMSRPSHAEIAAVYKGEIRLALFVQQPVIVIAFQCGFDGGGIPWSDAPFTIHRVKPHERELPPSGSAGALFRFLLVNSDSGVVEAMRLVMLASAFTTALHEAITAQYVAPWDERAYDEALGRLYAGCSSADLARTASHVVTVGAKR